MLCDLWCLCVFEAEASSEQAHGDVSVENNSAGSVPLPAEIKGEDPFATRATVKTVVFKCGFVPAETPPLKPPSTWTSAALKELKAKLRTEKDSVVTVYRGDIMTVHVPTVPGASRVCWEFATDGYDIGFGIYFDWTPVTSRAITVHISESSDDEDEEEELEGRRLSADQPSGSPPTRVC